MTMIEAANGYFESIRHILLGLQRVSSFRCVFYYATGTLLADTQFSIERHSMNV
jgi:hypothetical protein